MVCCPRSSQRRPQPPFTHPVLQVLSCVPFVFSSCLLECPSIHVPTLDSVLVFCCCRANYHQFRGLKQHEFIISLSLWARSLGIAWSSPLLKVSQSYHQSACWPGCALLWRSDQEESTSQFMQVLVEFIFFQLWDWELSVLLAVGWGLPILPCHIGPLLVSAHCIKLPRRNTHLRKGPDSPLRGFTWLLSWISSG